MPAKTNTSSPRSRLPRLICSSSAESLLLDWCYAPSPDLLDNYRAIWHSIHPSRKHHSTDRKVGAGPANSLPKLFGDIGYARILITDEPLLNSLAPTADFDEIV